MAPLDEFELDPEDLLIEDDVEDEEWDDLEEAVELELEEDEWDGDLEEEYVDYFTADEDQDEAVGW